MVSNHYMLWFQVAGSHWAIQRHMASATSSRRTTEFPASPYLCFAPICSTGVSRCKE